MQQNATKGGCSLFVQYEGFKSILWFTKFKPNVLSCICQFFQQLWNFYVQVLYTEWN